MKQGTYWLAIVLLLLVSAQLFIGTISDVATMGDPTEIDRLIESNHQLGESIVQAVNASIEANHQDIQQMVKSNHEDIQSLVERIDSLIAQMEANNVSVR